MEEAAAERRYKAFISYRHRPLDMAIAKKLHKRIERYVIPKDLRKNEEKKLGLVFRDQDELPIANNLSENIRIALDHAEFLIVICSPDTPQSIWVQREISYFLEHHSRDNVLAVLISGEPDVSFPPQLTEVRSPDGDLLETIEPLAANIVADSDAKRNQLFKTESLRILASLIGCPYDALYRREQRYKMRRLAAASIGIIAIAAAFIGLLLNRNAMIQEQLRTTQINESRTLAALSENASRDGDYRGALEDALNALPGRSPGRPYVAEAEKALGELVQPYRRGIQFLRFLQSVKQETEIRKLATPQNGTWFATSDRASQIHMYDLNSGEEKWSVVFPEEIYNMLTVEDTGLYVFGYGAPQILYSLEDGHILWQKEDSNISTNAVCSSKGWILEIKKENDRMIPFLIDARTGDTIRKLTAIDEFWSLRDTIISKDGKYAATIAEKVTDKQQLVIILDLETGAHFTLEETFIYDVSIDYGLAFTPEDDLILVCCGDSEYMADLEGWIGSYISLYDHSEGWKQRYKTMVDYGKTPRSSYGLVDYISSYVEYLACCENSIAVSSKNRLIMLDKETGKVRWQNDLPAYILDAGLYSGGNLMLVMADGQICMCMGSDGQLSSASMLAYTDCSFDFQDAAVIPNDSVRTTRYIVISKETPSQATVIGLYDNPRHTLVPGGQKLSQNARTFVSQDQTAWVQLEAENDLLHVVYYHRDGSQPKEINMTDVQWASRAVFREQCSIQLTNDGKLLIGGRVIDLETEEITYLSLSEEEPKKEIPNRSCFDPEEEKVLTASLEYTDDEELLLLMWLDGNLIQKAAYPYKTESIIGFYQYEVCGIAPTGNMLVRVQETYDTQSVYMLYSMKDQTWTEMSLEISDEAVVALADTHPWMALQKESGEVVLLTIPAGEETTIICGDLVTGTVKKLLFCLNDEQIMIFTNEGDFRIYRIADGTMLYRANYASRNSRFYEDARYEVYVNERQNKLLIIYDTNSYREPGMFVLDLDTYQEIGFFIGIGAWFADTDEVLLMSYVDTPATCPFFTLEELEEQGEQILSTGLPY